MIWEVQVNGDRKKVRIFAFFGACVILIFGLLILPMVKMTVERKKIPEYISAVLERYLKAEKPEVQVEPKAAPIRKTRAARIRRTETTRDINIERQSAAQLKTFQTQRAVRDRQFEFDHSPNGAPRIGINQPTNPTFRKANVPNGETARRDRDVGDGGSDGRRGRQINTGVAGPMVPSGGGKPEIPMESGGPRIIIPKTPPKGEVVVASLHPIIDWIEKHQKPVPVALQKPENLNQMPGDVTTWVTFTDTDNQEYTMYLLGRKGDPPQLNIFLKYQREGTLLQDLGAKGVNEVYKHGDAIGDFDKLTVQLSLLPPGSQKAREMMAIFQAWWEQIRKAEG